MGDVNKRACILQLLTGFAVPMPIVRTEIQIYKLVLVIVTRKQRKWVQQLIQLFVNFILVGL